MLNKYARKQQIFPYQQRLNKKKQTYRLVLMMEKTQRFHLRHVREHKIEIKRAQLK